MIIKTAIAVAALASAVPLAHQALDRVTRTETLATAIVATAEASAAGVPGADARWQALQERARALAAVSVPQTQPAPKWVPVSQWERAQ